jgi:hypothetical protein
MIPALFIAVSLAAFIHEDPVADRMIRDATAATYDLRLPEARRIARAVQVRYRDIGACPHLDDFQLPADGFEGGQCTV